MEYDQKVALAKRMHAYARDWRGRVLNTAAVIERDIALIIAHYFCTDEKKLFFFSEVATSHFFSFRSKIMILKKILKKDYQFFLENCPNLLGNLEKVKNYRNVIAHSTLDVTDDALKRKPEKGIGFIRYQDGSRSVNVLSEIDFNEWNGVMGNVSSDLSTLKMILGIDESI